MEERLGVAQPTPPFQTPHQLSHQPNMNAYDPALTGAGLPRLGSISSAPTTQQGHHTNSPNPSAYPQYSSSSVSPGPARDQAMPSPNSGAQSLVQAGQMSSVGGGGSQKRAYRQRRKDPSCDACRERKVKCDATDTVSCSECHSRNVKCQFTKETNRRMSSMKQVQDLEKQLAQAKATIQSLRNNGKEMNHENGESSHEVPLHFPEMGSSPQRRLPPPLSQNLTGVRAHLRNYCRGVFKPPPPYRLVGRQPHFTPPPTNLPDQTIADHILSQYYATVHSVIPILHWPQFLARYRELYRRGDLSAEAPSWAALLYSVLACGMLYVVDPKIKAIYNDSGRQFIEYSRQLTDLFNDEFTIDHARAALLTSVYMAELNCKSAAWTWLGSTVRIAQDIGLHRESGPWPIVEGEMRRRVWWGIYVWDRLLSVELGRVLLIDDADCDIGLPCPVDDHFIYNEGVMAPTGSSQHANFLLTTIHVVRLISPLLRTLQSPIISALTLSMFDSHFASCMEAFPPNCHINSQHPIEPRHLHPICHLQNARLVLHRHNLSTSCSVDIRTTALDSCVSAAKDTVHLLSRAIQWQPSDNMNKQEGQHGTWQQMLAQSATAMLCTHIWRCTLFLLFRGLYSEALVCVQFSSVIGEAREVNMACGRYLFGFLHALNDKLQRQERLENDEGMLALVSGDVQGSTESSWVWTGSETGSALQNAASAANDPHKDHQQASYESSVRLLPEEANDWGGWQNIELMINQLIQKNYPHPPPLSVSAMASNVSGRLTPAAPPMQSSTSRISIANII